MNRHYYISDNLDELEILENELEKSGIATSQIHVLSENDAAVEQHHLHEVEAVMRKDVVHATEVGALIGIVGAAAVLALFYFSGAVDAVGWTPFIFLAVIVLGFCTWEGGLFGIQEPHQQFKRFRNALHEGKHVFFVDTDAEQEPVLDRIVSAHPQLQMAGIGKAVPSWTVTVQKKWRHFIETMP